MNENDKKEENQLHPKITRHQTSAIRHQRIARSVALLQIASEYDEALLVKIDEYIQGEREIANRES